MTNKETKLMKRKVLKTKTEDLVDSLDESSGEFTILDYKAEVPSALISEDHVSFNSDLDNWNEKLDSMIEKIDGMWKCKICGKTNKQKGDARRHTETHTEGFSHSCNYCAKEFRYVHAKR